MNLVLPSRPDFKIKGYQEVTAQYCLKNYYCVVALDPGLGKTLVSCIVAFTLEVRTLAVVPSFLLQNWIDEINKFYPDKIVSVFDASSRIYPPVDSDIVLTTYNLVQRNEKVFDFVFEWAELVVVDEATAYKNMEAKRSESFHRLLYENSVKRCLLLTGTPLQNRVYELYSLIAICNYNPRILESEFLNRFPTWIDFADYFSFREEKYIQTKRGKKLVPAWDGFRNIAELKERYLKNIYIRFTDEVLAEDLPEGVSKFIKMKDIADDPALIEAFEQWNDDNDSVMPAIKKEMALKKVDFTCKYVEGELERFGKCVIYSDHVDAASEIASYFKVPVITGSTPAPKRSEILKDFINGKYDVLSCTIKSFNTGVTITVANWMVFNDLCWVPGDLEQARRRIRRIGQTKLCHYHYIFGSYQDERILESLNNKERTIREVT